jgi:hypothetical protein
MQKQVRVVERVKEHVDREKGIMFSSDQVLSKTVNRVVLSNIENKILPSEEQWEILVSDLLLMLL